MTDREIEHAVSEYGGNFTPQEFLEDRKLLKKNAIIELTKFRNWKEFAGSGFSFEITSAYRTTGSHKYGCSFDGYIWKQWKKTQPDPMYIWRLITAWPWLGTGIYFDWNQGVGVHLDIVPASYRQRPLRWLRVDGYYYYQNLSSGTFANNELTTDLQTEIENYSEGQENG